MARGAAGPVFGWPVGSLSAPERAPMSRHEGGYYVRLAVVDRPGAMAAIATRMSERKISLEAISQKRQPKGAPPSPFVTVVLITHATTEASIREALALTVADGVVRQTPQVIRIERA
jgi:homoserine dehydrogenase